MYDDDAILLEYDGANALQASYSHGEEIDQPLAMTRGVDSWFYHTDHLGSVRLLTNAGGVVVSNYDYDAFGNLEATSFEGVANPYAFTARERDAESGLMFYRARYYDPKIGRFISEDPIGFEGNDLNLYRYASNIPMMLTDPKGELAFIESAINWTKNNPYKVFLFWNTIIKGVPSIVLGTLLPGNASCKIPVGIASLVVGSFGIFGGIASAVAAVSMSLKISVLGFGFCATVA